MVKPCEKYIDFIAAIRVLTPYFILLDFVTNDIKKELGAQMIDTAIIRPIFGQSTTEVSI